MTRNLILHSNQNNKIIGHSGSGGQKGLIFNVNSKIGALCATDSKQPKQIWVTKETKEKISDYLKSLKYNTSYNQVNSKYDLSEKAINRILKTNNGDRCFYVGEKSMCLKASYTRLGRDTQYVAYNKQEDLVVCHTLQQRMSKVPGGGKGPLSRADGKSYCLDTANSMAIECVSINDKKDISETDDNLINNDQLIEDGLGLDYRYDEGFRFRKNGKSGTLNTSTSISGVMLCYSKKRVRRLTPIECCRLQTVPDTYFDGTGVSESQQYKTLGNGWTIDVIVHILSYIR